MYQVNVSRYLVNGQFLKYLCLSVEGVITLKMNYVHNSQRSFSVLVCYFLSSGSIIVIRAFALVELKKKQN